MLGRRGRKNAKSIHVLGLKGWFNSTTQNSNRQTKPNCAPNDSVTLELWRQPRTSALLQRRCREPLARCQSFSAGDTAQYDELEPGLTQLQRRHRPRRAAGCGGRLERLVLSVAARAASGRAACERLDGRPSITAFVDDCGGWQLRAAASSNDNMLELGGLAQPAGGLQRNEAARREPRAER